MDEATKLPMKRGARKSGRLSAPPEIVVAPTATAIAAVQAAEAQVIEPQVTKAMEPAPAAARPAFKRVEKPAAAEQAPAPAPIEVADQTSEIVAAIASPVSTPETTPAETLAPTHEGTPEMATVVPNMTDTAALNSEKLQSLFGDVGTRFKSSVEKSSKLGEEMVDLAKGNVEAVVASARVAAKGGEALGQDAAEFTKKSFESAVAAMKSFASVKSPTELFQLQSEFAKASFDSAVAEASKFSESMMKLAGDVAQPLSTRYAVAAEKIKSAAL